MEALAPSLFRKEGFTARNRRKSVIPGEFPRALAVTAFENFDLCPHSHYLRGPASHHGWEPGAPSLAIVADAWKIVEGSKAWVGHLFHTFSADVHFAQSDVTFPHLTKKPPPTVEELEFELYQQFEQVLKFSESMTEQALMKWRRRSENRKGKNRKKIWLWEHAMCGSLPDGVEVDKQDLRQLLERCVTEFLQLGPKAMGGAPPENWKVIEGMDLVRGRIVQPKGGRLSQRKLREKGAFPTFPIEVDGELWQYKYTVDRLVYLPDDDCWILIDYKTGRSLDKKGERKLSHQEQLRMYAAFLIRLRPEINPDNLLLRLIYVGEGGEEKDNIFDFALEDDREVERWIREAADQIRKYRPCFRRVDQVRKEDLLRVLPRHIALDDQGNVRLPPDGLVALPERFPKKAISDGNLWKCGWCDRRKFCPEGAKFFAHRHR